VPETPVPVVCRAELWHAGLMVGPRRRAGTHHERRPASDASTSKGTNAGSCTEPKARGDATSKTRTIQREMRLGASSGNVGRSDGAAETPSARARTCVTERAGVSCR
jgi:hypothetical protein